MNERISIREFLNNYKSGKYNADDVDTQCDAGWYDWFCDDSKLRNKTVKLVKYLKSIVKSEKIDINTMYVFFKNNCILSGELYDDFRICDMKTGKVIYTITPYSNVSNSKGQSSVWGRENGFNKPLITGTWEDVQKFFNVAVSCKKEVKLIGAGNLVQKIIRYCQKKGVYINRHYSGRYMFEKQCIGFSGTNGECAAVAEFIKKKTGKSYCSDHLGLDMIYYFPDIEDTRIYQ